MVKRLVLVRHTESKLSVALGGGRFMINEATAEMIKQIPDHKIPLTERGVTQARYVGSGIRQRFKEEINLCYDTGFMRTFQTREEALHHAYTDLLDNSLIESRSNPLLGERSSGYCYGMTKAEVSLHFPYLSQHFKTVGPFYAKPTGGENLFEVSMRVSRFVTEHLYNEGFGKYVFIFAHCHVIRAFRYLLEGWSIREFEENFTDEPKMGHATIYEPNKKTNKLGLLEFNYPLIQTVREDIDTAK